MLEKKNVIKKNCFLFVFVVVLTPFFVASASEQISQTLKSSIKFSTKTKLEGEATKIADGFEQFLSNEN